MMVGKYHAYPEYKDTGVEWLGFFPSHWEVSKHKYIATFKKGRNSSILSDVPKDAFVKYLSMDYLRGNTAPTYAFPESGSYLAKSGQPLIIWDGSNAGEFVKAKVGLVSSTMAALELKCELEETYYWYACLCLEPEMRRHSYGMGIPHVDGGKLKNSLIPLPKSSEQEIIANFLDHETAKIDILIEKQQQLIKLLKEKRQAVISHAVTKGLNPAAPMRDSGIAWLGEVPEHWECIPLKRLASIPIIDGPHETPVKHDDGVPFVSAEAVSNGFINFEKKWGYISKEDHALFSKRYSPRRGDILVIKLGATTGVAAIVDTDDIFNIWVPLAAIRCNKKVLPHYVIHALRSSCVQDAIRLSWTYGTQQTLGLNTLGSIYIPTPPKEEQKDIVGYLGQQVPRFEILIRKAENSIELLNERRTALISAAVTGKIDLRNWQAPAQNHTDKEKAA